MYFLSCVEIKTIIIIIIIIITNNKYPYYRGGKGEKASRPDSRN